MEAQCKTPSFSMTKGGFVVMLGGRLLDAVMEWMSKEIRIAEDGRNVVKMKDMLPYRSDLLARSWSNAR